MEDMDVGTDEDEGTEAVILEYDPRSDSANTIMLQTPVRLLRENQDVKWRAALRAGGPVRGAGRGPGARRMVLGMAAGAGNGGPRRR